MSGEKTFPALTGEGYTFIIKVLLDTGAWLPPTTTLHLSSVVLFWPSYKYLDDLFVVCAKSEPGYQGLSAEFVYDLKEQYEHPHGALFWKLTSQRKIGDLHCTDLIDSPSPCAIA